MIIYNQKQKQKNSMNLKIAGELYHSLRKKFEQQKKHPDHEADFHFWLRQKLKEGLQNGK